jgi:predicted pyridoxine 5'-phosphate oxidase superfamily flavin-nucleotide-binding protein
MRVVKVDPTKTPFHEGERAVQDRAGVRRMAEKIGISVDDSIPPPAQEFLRRRYVVQLGSVSPRGAVWASQRVGPPGFMTCPDERTVRIEAAAVPGDPLLENLRRDPHLGLLAIDLPTRRRYRVNGRASLESDEVIVVRVDQAYGNCSKYIQRREPVEALVVHPDYGDVTRGAALTAAQRTFVERADTFFLATAHPDVGADVSHRGGRPGFVRVSDDRTLVWPDYVGNTMFMSLGNLEVNPHAGLLFVDFDSGTTLQLTGTARIDWDAARAATFPGAQRLVELEIDETVETRSASPLRWKLVEPSPFNP